MRITRRLDAPRCTAQTNCPAIFELDDGRLALVGTDLLALADSRTVVAVPPHILAAVDILAADQLD